MVWKHLESVFFNSTVDLSYCIVSEEKAASLIVKTKRLVFFRLFWCVILAIPCVVFPVYTLQQPSIYSLLAAVFCPPSFFAAVMFGFLVQEKELDRLLGRAVKRYRILWFSREIVVPLPAQGCIRTYTDSSGEDLFYHIEIFPLQGFNFCISRDWQRRDEMAARLSTFLSYKVLEQSGDKNLSNKSPAG